MIKKDFLNGYFNVIIGFLIVIFIVAVITFSKFLGIFFSSPELNFIILITFCIALYKSFSYFLTLDSEYHWFKNFIIYKNNLKTPKLLTNLLNVKKKDNEIILSKNDTQNILDSFYSKLQEQNENGKYFSNLLIFLGLLGTFMGLLVTIASISNVINNFSISSDNLSLIFEELKRDLSRPLSGMGIAFSSSLLGLTGSLILNFINYQTNKASRDFYYFVEQNLNSVSIETDEKNDNPYLYSMLQQNAQNTKELTILMQIQNENLGKCVSDLQFTRATLLNEIKILANSLKKDS